MTSRFVIFFLISSVIFTITACAGPRANISPQREAAMLYAKASELQDADLYDEASAQFEEYVKKFPESKSADNAKLEIANGLFQQGKYDEAIAAYQEILDTYPESDAADQAMLSIGDSHFYQQKGDQAIEAYQKVLQKYPRFGVSAADMAQDRIDAIQGIEEDMQIIEEGPEDQRDNAQYDIADTYFMVFGNYEQAIGEFQKVLDQWPKSEMADEALWKIGDCYWNIATRQLPSKIISDEQNAYIRLIEIYDRFPQIAGLEMFRLDVHWPAGKRGDSYELAYAQARRIVNKYKGIKERKVTDYLPENYRKAFESWLDVIYKYPNTDVAAVALKRIALSFLDLGNLYYNMGIRHFGCILYRESLMTMPTPQGHLAMARYYANITSTSGQSWAYRMAFAHIKKAEEMTSPSSPLANEISWAKEWANYKMRIEVLENLSSDK